MTATTDSRQIGMIVRGILSKHNLDNLQLEIDLTESFKRYMDGKKQGRDIAKIREEILLSLEIGALKENAKINMEARVKLSLGIEVSGRSRYNDMIRFLLKKDAEGQSVELFAEWCRNNPFNAPKFFKIAEMPDLLMVNWPAAFAEYAVKVSEYVTLT